MGITKRTILYLTLGIAAFVLVGNIALGSFLANSKQANSKQESVQVETVVANEQFTYEGEEGKTAYELLTEQATIKENNSGLIVAINGREAVDAKREFWAFYVNEEQASVGPKDYLTTDEDVVEWRIERY